MRIAVSADERAGIASTLVGELERRGHRVSAHGALAPAKRRARTSGESAGKGRHEQWAWVSEAAAREVGEGRAEQAIVCCWTGTGASIAANKVAGVRAALCTDAATAAGARRWNDANVLALSLRGTSEAELAEILDAWFAGTPSAEADDRASIEHLEEIERRPSHAS
jgi:ribose 5-phosphate isomerase B